MRPQHWLLVGSVLLTLAVIWQLWLGPRWTQRIPPGWYWEINLIGTEGLPDPETGALPSANAPNAYERQIAILSESERPRSVTLEDRQIIKNPTTGELTWEYVYRAPVNPRTGEHLQAAFQGDVFVFPRELKKKSYRIRFSSYKGLPVDFVEEERIEGMLTYHFFYQGAAEYTESYASTAAYEGIDLPPGQEIRCADDKLTLNFWVERITGEIIKFDEACPSGDYIYDVATGQKLEPIGRWEQVSVGDSVIQRADAIRGQRLTYLWADRYLPALLLLTGLSSLCLGVMARQREKKAFPASPPPAAAS